MSALDDLPDDVVALTAAKRLGIQQSGWLGDWFMSYSPRNSNSNAEGTWDHWVDLALRILQHEATALVRPEAHSAVAGVPVQDFYDESARSLTDDEVERLFRHRASDGGDVS